MGQDKTNLRRYIAAAGLMNVQFVYEELFISANEDFDYSLNAMSSC